MKEVISVLLEDFSDYVLKGFSLGYNVSVLPGFRRIIVCGMGGSGIVGDILKAYLSDFEVVVVKDYKIPAHIKDGLVFCVSYSGNTAETISCYKDAINRGFEVVSISCGGKLSKISSKHVKVPLGFYPRFALPFLFFPILRILDNVGFYLKHDVYLVARKLKDFSENKISIDKIPLIYTSSFGKFLGLRLKEQLNENAKIPAFCNVFSEANHNEIISIDSRFVCIYLDLNDDKRITKRFKVASKFFGGHYFKFKERNLLLNIFNSILFVDWLSYHLAVDSKVDIGDISLIEKFKKKV